MLQTSIVATTNGNTKDLKAKVPTRFGSVILNTVAGGQKALINSLALSTGFGSADIGAEIVISDGEVVAQFDKVRLAPYEVGGLADVSEKRHPILRTLWKPDVYGLGFMNVADAHRHLQKFVDEAHSEVSDEGLLKMGAMLDLLMHKEPRLRILELGNNIHDITLATLDLLSSKSDFKRLSTYSTASFSKDGSLSGGLVDLDSGERVSPAALNGEKFDLIIIPIGGPWIDSRIEDIKNLLAEDATLLALCPGAIGDAITRDISCLSCPIADSQASLIVARQPLKHNQEALRNHKFLIVERERSNLGSALGDALRAVQGYWVIRVLLHELTEDHLTQGITVFNLSEVKTPLLATISDEHMSRVKLMTDRAGSIVWLTNGNILEGSRPDFSLVSKVYFY